MLQLIAWGLTTLVGAFVGSYLGGYLKKKGENLATHEDVANLVSQVTAVTQATKAIEAKISSDVWDQQKRWELKRDVIFEVARKIGRATEAMTHLHAVYSTEKQAKAQGLPERPEKQAEVSAEWNAVAGDFEGAIVLVSASCGIELLKVLLDFGMFMRSLSLEIMEGKPESFMQSSKDLTAKGYAVTLAIRKELGIPLKP
jgi:hypothetical protein